MASHRALLAAREARGADERPELHQCLIVGPGCASRARQQASRDAPDLPFSSSRLEVRVWREGAAKDPRDIGIDELGPLLVRERRHGAGGVFADTWQLAQPRGIGRERLVRRGASVRDVTGEAVEVAGARVVAEALPCFADLTRPRAREVGEGREALEEAIVVAEDARDLRLLEHQLRDEDAIRVARLTPGQIAAMRSVPGPQPTAEV